MFTFYNTTDLTQRDFYFNDWEGFERTQLTLLFIVALTFFATDKPISLYTDSGKNI